MDKGIHFISGLPRSGSTLLSAILRQNPGFHAGMSSPVGTLVMSLLTAMSARGEWADMIDDDQRKNVLAAVFDGYYQRIHQSKLVFDTNRLWCARMDAIAQLFPESRIIVCVRDMAWMLDSFERMVRTHDFENVTYEDGGEFDARLGIPGLHKVTGKVKFEDRPTILPPDVFKRFSTRSFWRNPRANPRKVPVLLPSTIADPLISKIPRPAGASSKSVAEGAAASSS